MEISGERQIVDVDVPACGGFTATDEDTLPSENLGTLTPSLLSPEPPSSTSSTSSSRNRVSAFQWNTPRKRGKEDEEATESTANPDIGIVSDNAGGDDPTDKQTVNPASDMVNDDHLEGVNDDKDTNNNATSETLDSSRALLHSFFPCTGIKQPPAQSEPCLNLHDSTVSNKKLRQSFLGSGSSGQSLKSMFQVIGTPIVSIAWPIIVATIHAHATMVLLWITLSHLSRGVILPDFALVFWCLLVNITQSLKSMKPLFRVVYRHFLGNRGSPATPPPLANHPENMDFIVHVAGTVVNCYVEFFTPILIHLVRLFMFMGLVKILVGWLPWNIGGDDTAVEGNLVFSLIPVALGCSFTDFLSAAACLFWSFCQKVRQVRHTEVADILTDITSKVPEYYEALGREGSSSPSHIPDDKQ